MNNNKGRGRKSKGDKTIRKHTKYSSDNITNKIKNILKKFLIIFVNNIINNIIVQYLLIIHKKIYISEKDNKEIYYFPFLQK